MGGPSLGFCGGRIDDKDGSLSQPLGPTEEQRLLAPCEVDGECKFPLGPTTLGLIYVNPAGPLGVPDQAGSALDIRSSFGNMGFDDRETVSLVGGGHVFGKTHGPCANPQCGDGIGPNTFNSGFEGPWTTTPTVWSNEYFNSLINFNWTLGESPAGQPQWDPVDGPATIMLTADLALTVNDGYKALVDEYAANITSLETDFAASWYRLTTQDMGPRSRCIGTLVPPAQVWQLPLSEAPMTKPDYIPLRSSIQSMIDSGDMKSVDLIRLAYQFADTFRGSDNRGGCNGARIRFAPQSEWEVNDGLDQLILKLETVDRGEASIADMIVLAGNTALEHVGGNSMMFCGGRVDASDAAFTESLAPSDFIPTDIEQVLDDIELKGLTLEEGVAVYGRPTDRYPAIGSLFQSLLSNQFAGPNDEGYYTADGVNPVTTLEYVLFESETLKTKMQALNDDKATLMTRLASAWTKLMNNDRFDGPTGNVCTDVDDATLAAPEPSPGPTGEPTRTSTSSGPSPGPTGEPTRTPTSSGPSHGTTTAVFAFGFFASIMTAWW